MTPTVGTPIDVNRVHMDRLRGRLFQTIEAVGLPSKQETAIKGLIRQLTYDAQADIESALRRTDATDTNHHLAASAACSR
jgi:hypothetical protein